MSPDIPIRNIYYMFLYAWGYFSGGRLTEVGEDDSPDMPNLFAKLLASGAARLAHRGLDRGYLSETIETQVPRGRMDISRMVKEQTALRQVAICKVDELSYDILHNRILVTTLIALASDMRIDRDLRKEIAAVLRQLPAITPIRLEPRLFAKVQLSRNSAIYGLLMSVCALLANSFLPLDGHTGRRFQNLLDDDVRMSAVFEAFLKNFYAKEQDAYRVGSTHREFSASAENISHLALLPRMRTDIVLSGRHETVILEAKYYRRTFDTYYGGSRLRSSHIYQLAAYLQEARCRDPRQKLRGVLVYPYAGQELDAKFKIWDLEIEAMTVDFREDWKVIRDRLLRLLS